MTTDKDTNDMLRAARQLAEQTDRLVKAGKKAADHSLAGQVSKEIREFSGFFNQVAQAGAWVYDKIGKHIVNGVSHVAMGAFNTYRGWWDKAVHVTDEHGEKEFSKKRAGLFLTATFAAVAMLPMVTGLVYDTTVYTATQRHSEIVYLHNAQEIDPTGNTHSVLGCEQLPCTDQNTISFRVSPSLFNHIWSLSTNGDRFYPDYVAGAVAPGLNKCEISSYGFRLKGVTRGMEWYPEILAAQCQPVSAEEAAALSGLSGVDVVLPGGATIVQPNVVQPNVSIPAP